ncbi:MAG: hypothetical protein M1823_002501 [Watsoniomyces obsoletus]|nr:MAG: hypothetical protein M1823_002501 [Watsoniomyces obsoletus]
MALDQPSGKRRKRSSAGLGKAELKRVRKSVTEAADYHQLLQLDGYAGIGLDAVINCEGFFNAVDAPDDQTSLVDLHAPRAPLPLDPRLQVAVPEPGLAHAEMSLHGANGCDGNAIEANQATLVGGNHAVQQGGSAPPASGLLRQGLSLLENLSVAVLEGIMQIAPQEMDQIVTQPTSESNAVYGALRLGLEETKKLYARREPFLSPSALGLQSPSEVAIIRKVNLATFLMGVFGTEKVGFFHLDRYFLDAIVPESARFLKAHGMLYLAFKTQGYLAAMSDEASRTSRQPLIDDLFDPNRLEHRLIARRPGAKTLTPSEADCVNRVARRYHHLVTEGTSAEAMAKLHRQHPWEQFVREMHSFVHGLMPGLLNHSVRRSLRGDDVSDDGDDVDDEMLTERVVRMKPSKPVKGSGFAVTRAGMGQAGQPADHAGVNHAAEKAAGSENTVSNMASQANHVLPEEEFKQMVERAKLDAEATLHGGVTNPADQPSQTNGGPQMQTQQQQRALDVAGPRPPQLSQAATVLNYAPGIPHPSQSKPTEVLYEQAKKAAASKASANNRSAGVPGQRRPWTDDETKALMLGVDMVRGPHWSQILGLFGAGGTISEALKDRGQIQIKDKARNLKLWFLKTGAEMPAYFHLVTGDPERRGTGQAARNAARQQAQQQVEDNRAYAQGVLTLAAGPHQQTVATNTTQTSDFGNGYAGMLNNNNNNNLAPEFGNGYAEIIAARRQEELEAAAKQQENSGEFGDSSGQFEEDDGAHPPPTAE